MSFLNILEEFMTKLRIRVIYCHFNIKLGITMSLKDNTKNNNADQIETRLASLGLKLPEPLKVPPDIQTPFAWVRIRGNQAYISGHGPQNPDGSIAGPFGKVGGEDVSLGEAYESAKLTGMSKLGSLKRELGSLDLVTAWLHVRGMVNVIPGFTQTTNVINGFSDLILKLYGPEVGMHTRSAVGVQSLALDVPVIIEGLVEIKVR
jgi:enamine deaminase RidA (YjgF/YER057c/UK114 family)